MWHRVSNTVVTLSLISDELLTARRRVENTIFDQIFIDVLLTHNRTCRRVARRTANGCRRCLRLDLSLLLTVFRVCYTHDSFFWVAQVIELFVRARVLVCALY